MDMEERTFFKFRDGTKVEVFGFLETLGPQAGVTCERIADFYDEEIDLASLEHARRELERRGDAYPCKRFEDRMFLPEPDHA